MRIDKEAGNYYWEKSLNKEIIKVKVSWKQVDGVTPDQEILVSVKELIGHQDINCHIMFDVRMDFQQKARFVAGIHMTEALNSITYFSVVSRDSISIGFLLAYIHGIDITAIDLYNTYLNAPCVEKIWFVGGDECGGG